jgi:hypothetical protein
MKLHLKNFSLRHYIRYMRRQSKHLQHVHAFVFALVITAIMASFILYTDYGFWHERYVAEGISSDDVSFEPESPMQSLSHFWQEAKERFSSLGGEQGLFEGKEVYKKEQKGE